MNIKGPLPPGTINTVKPVATVAQTGVKPQLSPQAAVQERAVQALLQVGQMLNAVVLKATASGALLQVENPHAKPDSPQLRLWTQPPIPLKQGQKVVMEVEQVAGKQPQLRLLSPVSETRQLLHQQLAVAQSKQKPLTPLLANVRQINTEPTSNPGGTPAGLKSDIVDRINTLWRQIPERTQLTTAPAMKQALNHAGPFLEASLAQLGRGERSLPNMDLRTGLLRLAATLRSQLQSNTPNATVQNNPSSSQTTNNAARALVPNPATSRPGAEAAGTRTAAGSEAPAPQPNPPPAPQPQARQAASMLQMNQTQQLVEELSAQVEGALARIQTHQLQSLNSEAQRSSWHVELPVKDENQIDLFDLRIQRDGGQQQDQGEQQHRWSVTLAFDLEGLGPLRVQVQLQGERIATHWWAEQAGTSELFGRYKGVLENRLNVAGLEVDQINCRCGVPRTKQTPAAPLTAYRVDQKV